MKKALAIALSLCMTAGLMAGCGSKPAGKYGGGAIGAGC